ncbi:MAG: hypothetical protein HDR24_04175 [Lachnospiraceae bacterium]|nr:hypothetical protein [Lachnospiraceae bacterium]MDE7444399.1 hypothetical protein [Lachnospiraceae bacterium]
MNRAEIKEFKHFVVECLIKTYNMDEVSATRAVRDSYLSKALVNDPDYTMHDTVEEWASYVYHEIAKENVELLQM